MVAVRRIGNPKFDAKRLNKAIRNEKREKGIDIEKMLAKTVRTWAGDKPRFKAKVVDRGSNVIIELTLTGTDLAINKWIWLDQGTDPHPIAGSPRLAFNNSDPAVGGRAYQPKTKPGTLVSVKGEPASGPLHFPEEVLHPGFPARNWTEIVREMMVKTFRKRVQVVLKRVVEKENS